MIYEYLSVYVDIVDWFILHIPQYSSVAISLHDTDLSCCVCKIEMPFVLFVAKLLSF